MAALLTACTFLQAGNRLRGMALGKLLHHVDRAGFHHAPATIASEPQVIPLAGEVVDRIEFVPDHSPDGTGGEQNARG